MSIISIDEAIGLSLSFANELSQRLVVNNSANDSGESIVWEDRILPGYTLHWLSWFAYYVCGGTGSHSTPLSVWTSEDESRSGHIDRRKHRGGHTCWCQSERMNTSGKMRDKSGWLKGSSPARRLNKQTSCNIRPVKQRTGQIIKMLFIPNIPETGETEDRS